MHKDISQRCVELKKKMYGYHNLGDKVQTNIYSFFLYRSEDVVTDAVASNLRIKMMFLIFVIVLIFYIFAEKQ